MFGALLFIVTVVSTKADFNTKECLNYTVYPTQYTLTVIPYINEDNSYYRCDVVIDIIANTPDVNVIELDARDLEILQGTIKVNDGRYDMVNGARPYEYDERNGKLYIYLREPLKRYDVKKGSRFVYNIQVSFNKYLNKDSRGLYLVNYYDEEDEETKYLYTSRFSPHNAVYSFPCFDKPGFESVFKFIVYVLPKRSQMRYMNTSLVISPELKRERTKDDYVIIEYMPSPQIFLHEVGFHYSQFGSIELKAQKTNDTLIVWAPSNKLQNYKFILHYGVTIMNLIHEFALTNRPLLNGPINLIAVPSTLDGYEISSWNLLTNDASKIANIDHFTSIQQIEHMKFELAQQLSRIWLGNPGESNRTKWKEEWLKEGMATYLAYYFLSQYNYGAQNIETKRPLGIYGLQMKHRAMKVDWHHSTRSLTSFKQTLAIEIPPWYRELVTMKTGAIWWMLEHWFKTDQLHQSLVKYINSMRGELISVEDFVIALDIDTVECSYQFFNGSTASRILMSWFHQPGYPVINVNVLRDRSPNVIQLKQRRFSYIQKHYVTSNFLIPISYLVQSRENCFNCHQPRFTISEPTYTFQENLNSGWIILNRKASGYYRVNYDAVTWRLIAKSLKEDLLAIDEMNRAQIVNDVFALYAAGDLDHQIVTDILDYLDMERSPIVWDSVINGFERLQKEGSNCYMTKYLYWEWEEFIRRKVEQVFNQLVDNKDQQQQTRLFRSNIISFACDVNHRPCLEHLQREYNQYLRGEQRLDPDTREAVYFMVANGTTTTTTHLQKLHPMEIEDQMAAQRKVEEKKRFLKSLPFGEIRTTPKVATEIPVAVTERIGSGKGGSVRNYYCFLTVASVAAIALFVF